MKLFRKIAKLTSWLIPLKKARHLYKDFLYSIDLKEYIELTHKNYEDVKKRLKNKPDKIKVIFLIRENQKWTYQSLYEELEKSGKFEPLVLVSILELARKGKDKTRNNLEENYNFFKQRGINVDYAYKDDKYVDLKEFSADIVFYDQPWDLPEIHRPKHVSEYALTFYSSYSYELVDCTEDYTPTFHRFLYKFFVEHDLNIERYESYLKGNKNNCIAVGYPKLNEYFKASKPCNIWKDNNKFKIIYAPHHSIERNGLRLATFKRNGMFILNLAKKYSETTWVFKPHPRLKYTLLRTKTMTEDEVKNYFDEWSKIGSVYEKGNYIDLFRTSDLMITDGCSFLAEYLPTEKPIIRLVNEYGIKLNKLGEKCEKGFYCAKTNSVLEGFIKELCVNKNDYKKNIRKDITEEILSYNKKNGDSIYDFLSKIIKEDY